MARQERRRTTEGNATRRDLQCVAPTRYSRGRCEGVAPFLVLLFFAFASCAWGACEWAEEVGGGKEFGSGASCPTDMWGVCEGLFNPPSDGSCYYGKKYAGWKQVGTPSCSGFYHQLNCHYQRYCCDTQAEADSVICLQNPTAAGCGHDTTLYACSEAMQGGNVVSTLYRLSCKVTGGVITECNGKTNVNIATDGTPVKTMQGTCAQNGYNNGITKQDSTGATADCFAALGSTCYLRDKRSGNTFTCECDGSCDYALRKLAAGDGCANPYPQDRPQDDSVQVPMSSYEPPMFSSSSVTSEPVPSFGNETEALSGLWGVLDTIRDTLNKEIAPSVENIQANTQLTNNYLQQLVSKEWSVNVEAPDVHVTNNTDVSGIQSRQDRQYDSDTAYHNRVLNALGALNDTSGVGNPNDTAGSGAALQSRLDKIDSVVGAFDVPDMGDSIAPTLQAVRGEVAAMRDSITGGVIGDSVNAWKNAFLNNGVLAGNGTNSCPSVLTRQVTFKFPHVGTIQAGTLGRYLCTSIAGVSVTLWQVARMLLRAIIAIGCMWWLFKEVTGTTTGGGNDDD